MLLNDDQLDRLMDDLDYILARTTCNSVLRTKGHILLAVSRDPDVLLDLVEALPPSDARWLSVPPDALRPLIARRARGASASLQADPSAELIPA